MKKHIYKLIPLSLVFLCAGCNNNNSKNESSYLEYSYNNSTNEASVTGMNDSTVTDVLIPDTVTYDNVTYKITSIGVDAFKASSTTSSTLQSIVLGNNITKIDTEAFYNCTSLRYIKFPDSLKTIKTAAFYNCTSLVNVELPEAVTTLAQKAFMNCSSLYSLYLPKNINKLKGETFSGCTSLKYLYIQDLESISSGDFNNCKSLKTIYFNQGTLPTVTGTNTYYESAKKYMSQDIGYVDDDTFYYVIDHESSTASVSGLKDLSKTNVEIKSSIEFMNHVYVINGIYDYAFYKQELGSVTIPSSVKTINKFAFFNCKLSSIDLSSVTAISNYALTGNDFTELSFNDDCNIAEGALSSCANLKRVTLPKNTTYMSKYLFRYDNLEYIIIDSKVTLINSQTLEDAKIDIIYYTSSKEDFEKINNSDLSNFAKANIEYNYTK